MPNAVTLDQAQYEVVIEADDRKPEGKARTTVTIKLKPSVGLAGDFDAFEPLGEDDPIVIYFRRSQNDISQALEVKYEVNWNWKPTAEYRLSAVDFEGDGAALTGTITIPANQIEIKLRLIPKRDEIAEYNETALVKILPGEGYTPSSVNSAPPLLFPNPHPVSQWTGLAPTAEITVFPAKPRMFINGNNTVDPAVVDPHVAALNDIRQGYLGNCDFWAATSAILQKDPEKIKGIFSDETETAVKAKFFLEDGTTKTVTVAKGLANGLEGAWFPVRNIPGGGTADATDLTATEIEVWPQVLEEAYKTAFAEPLRGQNASVVMHRLTGDSTVGFGVGPGGLTLPEFKAKVVAAVGAGKAVSVATKPPGSSSPLIGTHGYSVMRVNPDETVQLFNPHGAHFAVEPITFDALYGAIDSLAIQ